jgi:hypothetical protein
MKFIVAFAILVLAAFTCYCQAGDTVLLLPGNKLLEPGTLKSYTKKYDFLSYKDSIGTKIGEMEDIFLVLSSDSGKLGLRIGKLKFGANAILDSGLCFLQGLKPIYHHSHQTKKQMLLSFDKKLVSGNITSFNADGNKEEAVHYNASNPLFDSYYEDIIAMTIQCKKGLLFKFPEYIYERGGLVWSTGEIVGEDKVDDKMKNTVPVWKIVFHEINKEGKSIRTTTYLVIKNTTEIFSREYRTETSRIVMRQSQE